MSHIKLPPSLKASLEATEPSPLPADAPFFLAYSSLSEHPGPKPDKLWLEETKAGAFPGALRDEDGDGYHEIPWLRVALKLTADPFAKPIGLAHYFDDRSFSITPSLVALHFATQHSTEELERIQALAESHELEKAKLFFLLKADAQENPLQKIRPYLHVYLNLSAVHSGYGLSDDVQVENNPYGFSVMADGRWRVDCGIFAQLARAVLRDIPDLNFHYIYLRSNKPSQAHVVLLVSDANNRHLLVDNGSVLYFQNDDPKNFLIERFTSKGYDTLGMGGDEWEPYAKHMVFYPSQP